MKKKTQVYVLSRDRPKYLEEALISIIKNKKNIEFDIIVSDNSISNDVEELLGKKYSHINYIRRSPPLASLEHFKAVLNEASEEYLVIFHDDDLMMEDYVIKMQNILDANQAIAAVGCNGYILKKEKKGNLFINSSGITTISDQKKLLEAYFLFETKGIAPFPGYMYRRNLIKGLYLESNDGGKYSDVSFLSKLVSRAPIMWISEPLILYRIHDSNDSNINSINDRLKLQRFICKITGHKKNSELIAAMRYQYFRAWIKERIKNIGIKAITQRKGKKILLFLVIHTLKLAITKKLFWKKLKDKIL